jgi:ABC-type transporter Mla subunit MlaD
MDIDKLRENLAVILETLNTPSLTDQIAQDPDFGVKVKELETLVEKINIQHGAIFATSDDFSKILSDLSSKIAEIETYCNLNLDKLSFLKSLKPLN